MNIFHMRLLCRFHSGAVCPHLSGKDECQRYLHFLLLFSLVTRQQLHQNILPITQHSFILLNYLNMKEQSLEKYTDLSVCVWAWKDCDKLSRNKWNKRTMMLVKTPELITGIKNQIYNNCSMRVSVPDRGRGLYYKQKQINCAMFVVKTVFTHCPRVDLFLSRIYINSQLYKMP